MEAQSAEFQDSRAAETRPYASLSLLALAELIVDSDSRALNELHDARPIFRLKGGRPLLFAEFISEIRETTWARRLTADNDIALEFAYDLTVAKFCEMPRPLPEGASSSPDCRRAFRSFVQAVTEQLGSDSREDGIGEEVLAARILQQHVIRTFELSCLEARRHINPARSRYGWHVDGSVLRVWMPVSVSQAERRHWLERNIKDVDPNRPGERERVQSIIDKRLGVPRHLALQDERDSDLRADTTRAAEIDAETPLGPSLAQAVANEKAANLQAQRSSIRSLGAPRLRELVLRVFADLEEGIYEEKRLAETFGLSRATFTRFAGSRWRTGSKQRVPDLWANTAHTLANDRSFTQAAVEAGVWDDVQRILGNQPTCPGPEVR